MLVTTALAAAFVGGCGDDDGAPATEASTSTAAAPDEPVAISSVVDPEVGELPESDAIEAKLTFRAYIHALTAHDGTEVCELIVPGGIRPGELPRRKGNCAASVTASIGFRGPGGAPAWKRTTVQSVNPVSVGDDRARLTATVTHKFADRNYTSVEDDVIYLDHRGDTWLLAKPSGSFYRAIGYPVPPLRALTPP